jgi:Brp/Blh family beta-carotene 15,15'-monooxygenase
MPIERYSLFFCLAFVGLHWAAPAWVQTISPWFLAVGLIFPGIPHGAVDHWVRLKEVNPKSKRFWRFTSGYLAVMALIFGLWWLSPALGLLNFIAYSAWHFGETDLRDWHQYHPLKSWAWGLGVLLTILFSHFTEFSGYLQAYQIELAYPKLWQWAGLTAGVLGMATSLFTVNRLAFKAMATTALVVALGAFLPLLLSFALYFIVGHSFRGWSHLQQHYQNNFWALVKLALPFSLAAFGFLAISVGGLRWLSADAQSYWPWLFVFVAALSAPHVWVMHRFYQRQANS